VSRSLVLMLLAVLSLTGCSRPPHPSKVVDVSKGIYYTTDEIRGLTGAERDAYCESLDAQIRAYRTEADRLLASADSLSKGADSLRTLNTALISQVRDLDNEVRQLRLARRSATTYLVKAGDTLQSISTEVYGQPDSWKELYEANKDLISQPTDKLKPGIRLTIPAK
jgi:nucleoid-associated protein YgaU